MTKVFPIDIQGHRGCRGLLPENTIPAFLQALALGVTTLELDVVITRDKVVVVSHEAFLNHEICSDLSGNRILEVEERNFNIYNMDFQELIQFDCGLLNHPRFPNQKNIPVSKPSLQEMITECEQYAFKENRIAPNYNIEIKRTKDGDHDYHPDYIEFTDLVVEQIRQSAIENRTTIQCFDLEVLQYLKENYPNQKQVLLIHNDKSIDENIDELRHLPHAYSPYFELINNHTVKFCKQNNIKLIPWTVNETTDMKRLISMEVDGIITDYPDRLIQLF